MATVPEARPHRGRERERQVRALFSAIAPRYDLLNHVLSLNRDRWWRRVAVDGLGTLGGDPSARVLDACAGTLDLSLELAGRAGFEGRIVALDFARPMLVEGARKLDGRGVRLVCGDGLALPFPSGTFDGAMVAFGVRNLSDPDAGLRELARVLRPGGRLVVLEFSTPPGRLIQAFYLLYFRHVLPVVGRIVSGHRWAYAYLPESVREFPGPEDLARRLGAAGLRDVDWAYLTGGIAALHRGRKPG